jgi:hypothetical protein
VEHKGTKKLTVLFMETFITPGLFLLGHLFVFPILIIIDTALFVIVILRLRLRGTKWLCSLSA